MSVSANGNGKLPAGHFEEPVANGKRQLTPEEMRAKTEEMRIVNDYRLACIESNVLLESYGAYGWDRAQGFGGSDTTEFYLRMRQQAGGLAIPPSQPGDRRGGAKWPIWRTDVELNRLRQASRVLCASNDYAKGLLRNQTNYTIGKGFQYKVGPKNPIRPYVDDPGADQETNEQARKESIIKKRGIEKIVSAVQRWIDDFCARNNWNTAASPHEVAEDGSVGSASSTREREAHWRVDRDGEAIIRLFGREDGKVDVRFVGPEMVWGEPIGKSSEDGWSYGMQHLVVKSTDDEGREVRCDDLERICYYYIRPHEIRQQQHDKRHDAGGEIVPAREIVHIKDPWEDAEVKRGTPVFAYDTFDAISRATNLQRNVSITSSVQAATAEIWKHTIGTKSQIESLQNGPLARTVNAGDGAQRVEQRIFPGMIRRVPQGQEPVEYPGSTRVPEYQSAAQGDLRQAGASQSAPEFLVSGDASNGNFASISEAGVPYVRAAESRQEHFKTAFLRLMWRVISFAVKCRALPEEALTVVDIAVEGMEIAKNNEGELATSRAQNLASKVTSPQIECAKLGNDPQQVIADWKEWDKETAPAQPAPGGGPGAKQSGLNPPLGKGFTGVDKDKLGREYHWQHGKRVKASEKLASVPQEDLSGADVQESLDASGTGEVVDKLGRKTHWVNHKRVKGQGEVDAAKGTGDVTAKVDGRPVTVQAHDAANGLAKVKDAKGVRVVPVGYLDFGDDEEDAASEPTKEEPAKDALEKKPAKVEDGPPKHGQRANEVAAKRKELQELQALHAKVKAMRVDAFNSVKKDAQDANDNVNDFASELTPARDKIAWDTDNDEMFNEMDALISDYEEDGSAADRFNALKDIEAKAKECLAYDAKRKDKSFITDNDVKENKGHLQSIINNAREARTHLKEYVKHRKEMQAIKAGEPMDVQESMRDDGAASDWAALLESMEAPESVHRGQGWLDFGDDDGWVEIRPDGTDLL